LAVTRSESKYFVKFLKLDPIRRRMRACLRCRHDLTRDAAGRSGCRPGRCSGIYVPKSFPVLEDARRGSQQGGTPMPVRFGPGPVFIYESIAAARRWQLYALRSLFVLGLLAGMGLAWNTTAVQRGPSAGGVTISQLAALGETFYFAIATVQLALVLVVAPAATAGAICVDRARGNLTHMCVTDLTRSEIVLGKLAARLSPVFGLVAATVPVMALAGLLGGVIIDAIVTLTLITIVLAVFGCALALAFSVRATKIHEVLMAVYAIEAIWVIGPGVWMVLEETGVLPGVPEWYTSINPFVLAWAPYEWPNFLSTELLVVVLGTTLIISCALVAYAVLRLRADVTDRSRSTAGRVSTWLGKVRAWLAGWRRSPSLDDDPVLWREWRRGRPSRLARVVWGLYAALALGSTAWGIFEVCLYEADEPEVLFLAFVGGFQATFGLLLVSLTAPTVLAEERARGTLDVLMTSPVKTERIVIAKWWGAYRSVPALAFLPALGAVVIAAAGATNLIGGARPGQLPLSLTRIDRVAFVCFPTAMLLAQGAVVVSVGLALATWIARLGRAVAVSVASYAFVAFGWLLVVEMEIVTSVLGWLGLFDRNDRDARLFLDMLIGNFCPFGGQIVTYGSTHWMQAADRYAFYICHVIVLLVMLGFALLMLGLTFVTFDRSMGRMPERPRRAPRPPKAARAGRGPHVRGERREAPLVASA
jgi:ABC-type transport system involved in multi-copper enzyme maturation permease subunit